MLTLTRRLLGGALVAVVCAIAIAPHNQSLDELFGGPSLGSAEQAVTTHDPHSRASHWHAVIRFVKENPCLACHWNRLLGLGSGVVVGFALSCAASVVLVQPVSPASAPWFTLPSRGPPSLS
jgi:hypothetical protein